MKLFLLSCYCCFCSCRQGVCYRLLYCLLCNVIYTHTSSTHTERERETGRQKHKYNVINAKDTKAIPHDITGRQNKRQHNNDCRRGRKVRERERRRERKEGRVGAKSRKYALGINDKLPARKRASMARHGHGPLLGLA